MEKKSSVFKKVIGVFVGGFDKDEKSKSDLRNISIDIATKAYKENGVYFHCEDGQVVYAGIESY